jgi:hypothetical protein
MGPVALGVLALVLVLMLIRAFVLADAKVLVRVVRYTGAVGLGIVTVFLALTGRMGPALFLGSMAWGLATGGHIWPAAWPHYSRGHWGKRASSGATSVRSNWVEMQLDHETGAMNGTVLKGPHTGDALDQIDRPEILALYYEAAADDPESARLIEAYLDRRFGPEWRSEQAENTASPGRETMSRDEAFKIIGLKEGATEEEIRNAHRRLMMQIHPDRGGSDYLAAKINQARDILLGN